MKNVLFIILFCGLTMSFIKPGQLKKVVRCELYFEHDAIYPGNVLDLSILTQLKDSTVISSETSNLTINFADYEFELKGGAEIQEKTRTKLTLKILDEAYTAPFVEFSIKLRRKKRVKYTIRLPIRYDVTQKVTFIGENGYDPRSTTAAGFRKIPLTQRVNLEFIDNTQTLTNNSDPAIIGGKGPDMDVYVSLIQTEDQTKFLKVEVKNEWGEQIYKYLRLGEGTLEIITIGGKGGISKSGGKGGQGGNVTVFIAPEARPYFDQIFIVNHGGDGGELWRPKVDGQQQGAYGDNGDLIILDWDR